MTKKHYYLIRIQFLGYRYSGWAKQPNQKTVHGMIDRTLPYVLGHDRFKTLGGSRTDARVSALDMVFELFLEEAITDEGAFLKSFNLNLPYDIRAVSVQVVDEKFNIIQNPKMKEYLYFFAFGEKVHPFCAPLMATFSAELDIELMMAGAQLFEGTHNFKQYCTKPSENTQFVRTIEHSRIEKNTQFTASFFPENSYVYTIRSKGFMRYQVRLMMGQLEALGKGEVSLDDIRESLVNPPDTHLRNIAPGSGLILNSTQFNSHA